MKDFLKSDILKNLYELKREQLESDFFIKHGKPLEVQNSQETEEELENTLNNIIKNKDEFKRALDCLEKFKVAEIEELIFWNEQFYKQGFIDAINLKNETQDQKSSFFENYLDQFIEEIRCKEWYKKTSFKRILNKISEIKNKYHNVLNFFEDNGINELTIEELNAVHEIIILNQKLGQLEQIEIFKLGLKENNLL